MADQEAFSQYVPKKTTQAQAFVEQYPGLLPKLPAATTAHPFNHPEYDGRGVIVAVVDSACEVGHPGLSRTSTGERKLLDVVDCSGRGDVPMRQVEKTLTETESGDSRAWVVASSSSNKKLLLNAKWQNPSGTWRHGHTYLDRLLSFNSSIAARPRAERSALLAQAVHGNSHMETIVEALDAQASQIIDCLVWHDGTHWCAALDVKGDGDLSQATALHDFRVGGQWGDFGDAINANFCTTVFEEGSLLSVIIGGGHGTHCAGTVAACYPDDPARNGVAPGAQVVSICIADRHYDGGMESSTSLARAIGAIKASGAHVVTMSYGEADIEGGGSFGRELAKLITENNMIFVTSAGNSGPRLRSGNYPHPDAPHFTVAATRDPDLVSVAMGMFQKEQQHDEMAFTSRGPHPVDDGLNANIAAPGSSIAPVPRHVRSHSAYKQGTSMATPNVAGCLALLLSAFVAKKQSWTPYSIHSLVLQTASKSLLASYLTSNEIGLGLIQILDAYELCLRYSDQLEHMCEIITYNGNDKRGLFFMDSHDVNRPSVHLFRATPRWSKRASNQVKSEWKEDLSLSCSVPWVKCPDLLTLTNLGCSMRCHVDPTALAENAIHTGLMQGHDSRGMLRFSTPFVVARPVDVEAAGIFTESFDITASAAPKFCYVRAPRWATHATATISVLSGEESGVTAYCTIGQFDVRCGSTAAVDRTLRVGCPGQSVDYNFPVVPQRVVEMAIKATHNRYQGSVHLNFHLKFYSFVLQGQSRQGVTVGGLVLNHGHLPVRVSILNLGVEARMTTPAVKYNAIDQTYSPSSVSRVTRLSSRYDNVYQLVQTFNLQFDASSSSMLHVGMDELSYSGCPFQWTIDLYTELGLHVHSWGWGGTIHTNRSYGKYKFTPGSWIAKVTYRHPDSKVLEKYKSCPLVKTTPLSTPITQPLFKSFKAALQFSGRAGKERTFPGDSMAVNLQKLEKIPQGARNGDILVGVLEFSGNGKEVHRIPVSYVVQCAEPTRAPIASTPPVSSLADALYQATLAYFAAGNGDAKEARQFADEHSNNVQAQLVYMRICPSEESASAVLQLVDLDEMARHFGVNCSDKPLRAAWIEKRDAVIEALTVQGNTEELAKWKQPGNDGKGNDKITAASISAKLKSNGLGKSRKRVEILRESLELEGLTDEVKSAISLEIAWLSCNDMTL